MQGKLAVSHGTGSDGGTSDVCKLRREEKLKRRLNVELKNKFEVLRDIYMELS